MRNQRLYAWFTRTKLRYGLTFSQAGLLPRESRAGGRTGLPCTATSSLLSLSCACPEMEHVSEPSDPPTERVAERALATRPRIDAAQVKELLLPFTGGSLALPAVIFAADVVFYLGTLALAVFPFNLWLRVAASLLLGLAIGTLFIIGHDACHGSFTKSDFLNKAFGRVAFLPSLHAFSLWRLGHNAIHHRYVNLNSTDYVWTPLSKLQYDKLNGCQRWLYRFYRTVPGHAFYYLYEIWWKKMVFPNRAEVPERRSEYLWDSLLVTAYAVGLVGVLVWVARWTAQPWWLPVLLGFVTPYFVWNWLMGFVIFLHHTHPSVAWFDGPEEWNYWESQIEGTTHVNFPRVLNFILHNILEHTAHHALTNIPMYRLRQAQDALESRFGNRITVVEWTLSGYLDTLKRCRLYDYRNHRWLDYQGKPTTSCTLPKR